MEAIEREGERERYTWWYPTAILVTFPPQFWLLSRRNFGYFPAVWLISRLAVHFPTRFWLIPPPPLVDFLPHFVVDDTPRGWCGAMWLISRLFEVFLFSSLKFSQGSLSNHPVSSGLFHFALTLEQATDSASTSVIALKQASVQLEDGWGSFDGKTIFCFSLRLR